MYNRLREIDARRRNRGCRMNESPNREPRPGERDRWIAQKDDRLLAESSVDLYRASGPGGQKRNKTSSAVRLRHIPSGLMAIAEESRSQHENKTRALRRLRLTIALTIREPVGADWRTPLILKKHLTSAGGVEIARRNAAYPAVVAVILDTVAARRGGLKESSDLLGLTTGQLSKFITSDGKVLAAVNRLREEAGIRPLAP